MLLNESYFLNHFIMVWFTYKKLCIFNDMIRLAWKRYTYMKLSPDYAMNISISPQFPPNLYFIIIIITTISYIIVVIIVVI